MQDMNIDVFCKELSISEKVQDADIVALDE